ASPFGSRQKLKPLKPFCCLAAVKIDSAIISAFSRFFVSIVPSVNRAYIKHLHVRTDDQFGSRDGLTFRQIAGWTSPSLPERIPRLARLALGKTDGSGTSIPCRALVYQEAPGPSVSVCSMRFFELIRARWHARGHGSTQFRPHSRLPSQEGAESARPA